MNENNNNNYYSQDPWEQGYSQQSSRGYTYEQYTAPKAKKSGGVKIVCLALVCALIGGAVGTGGTMLLLKGGKSPSSSATMTITQGNGGENVQVDKLNVDSTDRLTPSQIYNKYNESVVSISVETANAVGAGTGFVISEEGYIVTCYHVVDGASAMSVTFTDNAESFPAKYIGGDELSDIAVIKIEVGEERELHPVVLGDSEKLGVGDDVTAIGNALGTLSNTTTVGIVSALNRAITMSDGTVMSLMQTDCSINSGNSGGPLFNAYGEVIGMVNAKFSNSEYESSGQASIEGIGFAIPINDITAILDDLVNHGYVTGKPYLGISVSTVSALTAQRYDGYVEGAYINKVNEGSCAETAGLKVGDIVTSVDGVEITTSAELIDAKNRHRAGEDMELTVYRNKEYVLVVVTLDEQTPEREAQSAANNQQSNQEQQGGSSHGGYSQDGYSGGYQTPYDWFTNPFPFYW